MEFDLAKIDIDLLVQFGYRLAAAAAIFVVGRWLAKLLTNFARKAFSRSGIEDTLERFLCSLIYAALLTAVIIAAINQLGVQTTSLLAIVGAAGLAIGLALQGSLSNFAAGVMIVGFRPYRVGDVIEAAGVAGKVEEVQIFTTVLLTPDNKKIIIPNSQIMDGEIINYSAKPTRRIDLVAGCGYDDDLDKVRRVLNDIVAQDERILPEPEPVIAVSELGDSSVNFVVRPWVKSEDYWSVRFDLTEKIKKRFDEESITIPFPQRDVHIYNHDQSAP